MTLLDDLFSQEDLDRALAEGFVRRALHPHRDLALLNYTEKAQYEGAWNPVTSQCRGLIYDSTSRTILARPFPKFHNWGTKDAPPIATSEPVLALDKLDGSLGILYGWAGDWSIATRGSFTSDQAHHASEVFRRLKWEPPEGWTVLFEIVYPENRIVLDYGDRDELVLLGAVEIATGQMIGPDEVILDDWPGSSARVFDAPTLAHALAIPPRANAEGVVIFAPRLNVHVKVKQEDYVALHRIIMGLNERTVWEHIAGGKPLLELIEKLPDEFHGWVGQVAARLVSAVALTSAEVESVYDAITMNLPEGHSRKEFAMVAKEHPRRAELFARRDGKDYRRHLWDEVRPGPRLGPRGLAPSEETA